MGTLEDKARAELTATLARLGVAETAFDGTSKTIARPNERNATLPSLPPVSFAASDLTAVRELGRGGMGVVHLAQQRSLEREVAVKTSQSTDPAVHAALVREARITGALEHPNLVPVHALGVDAAGAPVLVMKRVEGVTLRELLDDPAHPTWKSLCVGHQDELRAQIEILMNVCRALAFAHSRGVVHRDIKPENVMIGSFGEVYVLDWGVALRLSERGGEPRTIVGTPGYLAPEMAAADPTLVDERTDVYLLGGTLYEMLTARVPHDAPTALAALVKALLGEVPPIPDDVPPELAALVRDALAKERDARPATVEAFREELARFLVHRDADLIARDARAALARADEVIAAGGLESTEALRALVEARVGFSTAARMRRDDELRGELDVTLLRLVAREIALRSPVGARALLADVSAPDPAALSRIEALEAQLADERRAAREIADVKREADVSRMIGPLTITIALGAGVGIVVGSIYALRMLEGQRYAPSQALALDLAMGLAVAIGVVVGRKRLFATEASRRTTLVYVLMTASLLASEFLSYGLGEPTRSAAAHTHLMATAIAAVGALATRRGWAAVPILLAGLVGMLALPSLQPVFSIVTLTAAVVVFVYSFRSGRGA